jgi:hypothetical protein
MTAHTAADFAAEHGKDLARIQQRDERIAQLEDELRRHGLAVPVQRTRGTDHA